MLTLSFDGCPCQLAALEAIANAKEPWSPVKDIEAAVARDHGRENAKAALEGLRAKGMIEPWVAWERREPKNGKGKTTWTEKQLVTFSALAAHRLGLTIVTDDGQEDGRWMMADPVFWGRYGRHPGEPQAYKLPPWKNTASLQDPRLGWIADRLMWPDREQEAAEADEREEYLMVLRDRQSGDPVKLFGSVIPVDTRRGKPKRGKAAPTVAETKAERVARMEAMRHRNRQMLALIEGQAS